MTLLTEAGAALAAIRKQRPLIHQLTNFVTMTACANVTLAVGASPTMTNAVEEAAEMAQAADALVLNLGTLQQWTLDAMFLAGRAAAQKGIPIILDPVGAGGTTFRTHAAESLLQALPVTIIRGNLSEVTCLAARQSGKNLGVDSHEKKLVTIELIESLAKQLGTTVVITGAHDAVSDGKRSVILGNGCDMLTYVTGTGCMTTSLIASFASVASPFIAAVGGVTTMSLAGELAAAQGGSVGPGTFHGLLFDCVYAMTPKRMETQGKVLIEHES